MTGDKKGQKKETGSLFVSGSKKNSVKKKTYTLKITHHFLQHDHITT